MVTLVLGALSGLESVIQLPGSMQALDAAPDEYCVFDDDPLLLGEIQIHDCVGMKLMVAECSAVEKPELGKGR